MAHWSRSFNSIFCRLPLEGTLMRRRLAPSRSWYSFYRPRKDGKLSQLRRKRRSHKCSTRDLVVGRQRYYHCANHAASYYMKYSFKQIPMYKTCAFIIFRIRSVFQLQGPGFKSWLSRVLNIYVAIFPPKLTQLSIPTGSVK